ncbi:hypothetical protein ITK54_001236 [Salmonella enterica]|nr:hypothetical protein [Salmonella enterica subsp. houtenae]EGO0675815.1 hypothetical protein [Salmonella enterica]EGO0731047.1 hypothetical protein [Salmonella enterica]EGO0811574.1 hypothetical protein [Salmonella enterica]EGO0817871.1 hypothetical protein [Salmonella enterica]
MTVKTAPVPDRQTLHHPARHFCCAKQQSDVASHHHDSPLSTPTDSDGNNLTHPKKENFNITGKQEPGQLRPEMNDIKADRSIRGSTCPRRRRH